MKMRFSGMTASLILAATMSLAAAMAAPADAATEDWNDAGIKWMGYEEGLAAAKANKKPICLIFYTTWCPHCANYSKLFNDEKLVDKSKSFVMIRLDKDKNKDLSARYKPDGEYIPRTYFLSSDGKLDESLTADRPQYKYFYAESDVSSILGGMDRALQKLK